MLLKNLNIKKNTLITAGLKKMTISTESVGTTITITSTSSIATRSKTELIPIGFLPSYLPSSTVEIGPLSLDKNPPPYPLDKEVPRSNFPSRYSPNMPSKTDNNPPYPLDVTSVDKAPPPYPLENALNNKIHHRHPLESQDSNKVYGTHLHPPYFASMASNNQTKNLSSDVNPNNELGLENTEKEVIMIALSQMKCKALWKSDEEKKEFYKAQTKVTNIINDANSSLTIEEKEKFEKEIKKINDIRNKYLKEQKEKNKVEENGTTDANSDETGDSNSKCSFDITLLLLKIPQLVIILFTI